MFVRWVLRVSQFHLTWCDSMAPSPYGVTRQHDVFPWVGTRNHFGDCIICFDCSKAACWVFPNRHLMSFFLTLHGRSSSASFLLKILNTEWFITVTSQPESISKCILVQLTVNVSTNGSSAGTSSSSILYSVNMTVSMLCQCYLLHPPPDWTNLLPEFSHAYLSLLHPL